MSTHIGAKPGQIAPLVLMPGDPMRAKWIAENFLEGAELYNEIRGMLGYTGTWKGQRVSVQGSGMGLPSLGIYVHELFAQFDVQKVIRVGTCGGMSSRLNLRDVVIASGASTDSAINRLTFGGIDYAPVAGFDLLRTAADLAADHVSNRVLVGPVLSSDSFYHPRHDIAEKLAKYGVLAVEMEAAGLYTKAAEFGREALAILTVSDHIFTGEGSTAQERESTYDEMVNLALATITA